MISNEFFSIGESSVQVGKKSTLAPELNAQSGDFSALLFVVLFAPELRSVVASGSTPAENSTTSTKTESETSSVFLKSERVTLGSQRDTVAPLIASAGNAAMLSPGAAGEKPSPIETSQVIFYGKEFNNSPEAAEKGVPINRAVPAPWVKESFDPSHNGKTSVNFGTKVLQTEYWEFQERSSLIESDGLNVVTGEVEIETKGLVTAIEVNSTSSRTGLAPVQLFQAIQGTGPIKFIDNNDNSLRKVSPWSPNPIPYAIGTTKFETLTVAVLDGITTHGTIYVEDATSTGPGHSDSQTIISSDPNLGCNFTKQPSLSPGRKQGKPANMGPALIAEPTTTSEQASMVVYEPSFSTGRSSSETSSLLRESPHGLDRDSETIHVDVEARSPMGPQSEVRTDRLEVAQSTLPLAASKTEPSPWRPVINHVATEIGAAIRFGKRDAVICLDPPELGLVRIDLRVNGDRVEVRVFAECHESRVIIETHLPDLCVALGEHQLELLDVQFQNWMPDGSSWDAGPGGQQHRSGQRQATNDTYRGNSGTGREYRSGQRRRTILMKGRISMWA